MYAYVHARVCRGARKTDKQREREEKGRLYEMVAAPWSTFYIISRQYTCNETARRLLRVTRSNNTSLAREIFRFPLLIYC